MGVGGLILVFGDAAAKTKLKNLLIYSNLTTRQLGFGDEKFSSRKTIFGH